MIESIKNLLKKNKKLLAFLVLVYKYKRKNHSLWKTFIFTVKSIPKVYIPSLKDPRGTQIKKLMEHLHVTLDDENFVYYIDPLKMLYSENYGIENTTIDYSIVLKKSLEDMRVENEKMTDGEYKENQKELLDGIVCFLEKEITAVKRSNKENKEKWITYLDNIKTKEVENFEEALQRILFYNQLLWQTGHPLNGIGRLDKILDFYYKKSLEEGVSKENIRQNLSDFMKILHRYYWVKSNSLLGDTGQIIILGGKEENGTYFCNDLTYMIIEEIQKLQLPDPKILLRISKDVPRDLMETSVKCIQTGIGCPLFSNDDVIIPKLISFGYQEKDAYNYVTSACWEPLITGKSFDQNNMKTIVFMKPFEDMLNQEDLNQIHDYEKLLNTYQSYLDKYIHHFFEELDQRKYEKDPLLSLFIPHCNETCLDVTEGGAIYNHYGVTSVSLANTVNSILNINEFVFKNKKYSLTELNEYRKNNFEGHQEVFEELKNSKDRYGKDEKYVYQLVNTITSWVNEVLKNKLNRFGGRMKFGLSAPTYIDESKNVNASLDGRKNGDAFTVHISSDITSSPYTELIGFASKIDYSGNRFNGNVIDFMVTPHFMENNFEKFTDFLILSINVGFFQMQMNVIGSETLIRAKKHPEEFPNLIVRVWGFSSYFNDLPEEYKNVLIERALCSEGKSY